MVTVYADNLEHTAKIPIYNFDFVYLHGELDAKNGFDLCSVTKYMNNKMRNTKEYKGDCRVVLPSGEKIVCNLYFWHTGEGFTSFTLDGKKCYYHPYGNQHGLICLKDDKEGNAYALSQFNAKVEYLM